jgi:hypothetical protein
VGIVQPIIAEHSNRELSAIRQRLDALEAAVASMRNRHEKEPSSDT